MIAARSRCDRLRVACKRVLAPPHPLNWIKLHPKLTTSLLETLIFVLLFCLWACEMIYGGAHEAFCVICVTTMGRHCRRFAIPNE